MKKNAKKIRPQKAQKNAEKSGKSVARPAGDGLAAAAASPVTQEELVAAFARALKRIPDEERTEEFVARLGHLEVQLVITRDPLEFIGGDDTVLRKLAPAKGALNAPGCTRVPREDGEA